MKKSMSKKRKQYITKNRLDEYFAKGPRFSPNGDLLPKPPYAFMKASMLLEREMNSIGGVNCELMGTALPLVRNSFDALQEVETEKTKVIIMYAKQFYGF